MYGNLLGDLAALLLVAALFYGGYWGWNNSMKKTRESKKTRGSKK